MQDGQTYRAAGWRPLRREGGDLVGGGPDHEGELGAGLAMAVPSRIPEEDVVARVEECGVAVTEMSHHAGVRDASTGLEEDGVDVGGVTGLLHDAMDRRVAEVDRGVGGARRSRRTWEEGVEVAGDPLTWVVAALVAGAPQSTIARGGGAGGTEVVVHRRSGAAVGVAGALALALAVAGVPLEEVGVVLRTEVGD